MKNLLSIVLSLLTISAFCQNESTNYSVFNPKNLKKEFFIATNSGVLNTPVGLKIGFISDPGLYVGFRHGIGKVFNSDSDLTINATPLFSATVGINKPLIIQGDFKLIAQFGGGYGQWWNYRWERWTKSGYEFEGGLMVQKKSFLFSLTGNYLGGPKTYPTGDVCVGIGYTLRNCE
ncbi:MAG TPA: hypothetical protein VGD40_05200 [Chryseosolibacter sp.]